MLLNGGGRVIPSFAGAALRATILGLCGIVAGVYLLTSFASVGYPYLLEWMEGGTAEGIHRILTGQPLYVRPTLDYTPYIYPPLYFWLSGGAAVLIGNELLAARAVSFVSTLLGRRCPLCRNPQDCDRAGCRRGAAAFLWHCRRSAVSRLLRAERPLVQSRKGRQPLRRSAAPRFLVDPR